MMIDLWRRHIAWRLARTVTHERKARATVVLRKLPISSSSCVKCPREREDGRFKLCQRCRMRASYNSKKRRVRLARKGACVKCGRQRDSYHIVCTSCRASERARYHARGKAS